MLSQHSETIVILGAGGMLASALEKTLNDSSLHFYSFSENQLDITDLDKLKTQLLQVNPSVIFNTAAYTDVDGCEENVDLAFAVNSTGAGNVAKVSAELGAKLVHISTDYVFNGKKESPYNRDDTPDPQSVYGKSKLEGEINVRKLCENHLIVRTSWLFGPWGKNFVQTMLGLANKGQEIKVVNDQRGCPTYTLDLADALKKMASSELTGTHHLTNTGSCTWYEFAAAIFKFAGKNINLIPVSSEEFPRPAPRPKNSVLDCSSTIKSMGYPPPKWEKAVEDYLREYLL